MRGKEMNDVVTLIDRRITPAYAGKSYAVGNAANFQ